MAQRLAPYATQTRTPRLIMSCEGLEGCGKTHFSLTGPKPLAYFSLDRGFEASNEEKKIRLGLDPAHVDMGIYSFNKATASLSAAPMEVAKACEAEAWVPFLQDYAAALTKGRKQKNGTYVPYRTIVVDTCSELWETCRLARFGKTEQVPPMLYTAVNAEFRGQVLDAAFASDCNVIFIHKQKDEYQSKISDKGKEVSFKTGKIIRTGFKEIAYRLPILVQHRRDLTLSIDEGRYQIYVDKCAPTPELEGDVTPSPIDFAGFAQLVYPNTTDTDWS